MKDKFIFHIDFNSFFATVEQQANPQFRGKPIGVTGGDRIKRTVLGAASVEAKKFGVKTGMRIGEALKLCPNLILVKGDSDKYLECTKRFINILKDYSPKVEVFSIDEVFLALEDDNENRLLRLATDIKERIHKQIGSFITCSIGISYNKVMAKFAGSLYKPDGLVAILDKESAQMLLDRVELDALCGIGSRIKNRLNNMGVFSFKDLRKVPLENLLASFKNYGKTLYGFARGESSSEIIPFYEKEEVKSVGHRHTISYDIENPVEIKQVLLKLTELIARRLRAKKLVGRTVVCYYRAAFQQPNPYVSSYPTPGVGIFEGSGMQITYSYTSDGLEIFKAAWKIFKKIWQHESIRMVGVSVSNLRPKNPQNLSLLNDTQRQEKIIKALDKINDRYGEFTLQRGILLNTPKVYRKPNPFLTDRRFKL